MDLGLVLEFSLRTLLSMIIGGIIGWERESTHRPAGLRTHMLVAVGACVIMQLGDFIATQYQGISNIDPARLGAQVISGIGFLGAGTIMREGLTVKGLTTAASLWVVACLGLAAGSGAYEIAVIGFFAIMITLTIFEKASSFVPGGKHTHFFIALKCYDINKTLDHLNEVGIKYFAEISDVNLDVIEGNFYDVSFKLSTHKSRKSLVYADLLKDLTDYVEITSIKLSEY
ncbi:MAG: MgtC/SapB family protein [Turicibacter sp.]